MFNADDFKSQSVEGEVSTQATPVPEGEYNAVIKSTDIRETNSEKGTFLMLDVQWLIDDDSVIEATGRDENVVRQTIFLDVSESGGLDMGKGKNTGLGRLRTAVNQATPGPWNFTLLDGNVAKVKVEHRMYNGNTYADVKNVVAV